MFHTLRFSNFYSFLDEVEINFLMDNRSTKNEKSCDSSIVDCRVSKVIAVIGPNGAGKTNIIKPFSFLSWFISGSFFIERDQDLYAKPHFLSPDSPSEFEAEFEIEKRLFKYHLKILNNEVIEEHLFEKTSRLWSRIFERRIDGDSYLIKQRGFGLDGRLAKKVKKNASLISTAAEHNISIAVLISNYFRKTTSNISWMGRSNFQGVRDLMTASSYFSENEHHKEAMSRLIRSWDFGIDDIAIEKVNSSNEAGKPDEKLMPFGVHCHEKKTFKMPFMAESSGTQAAYHLLSKLLPVLENGGFVAYDELESDLHPLMLESIMQLFFSDLTNPHNAQIIFTTHSVHILNELQKSQILLVEKNDSVSEAWRLSDMQGVRSDDNFYAKYMSGTYGAIPIL
ncbi:hypothetical protein NS201_10810 [Pseudomonas oryzihabitans]|nr:hypothetical protein NS201_10810 [Pseudomonas psychrotolerans]